MRVTVYETVVESFLLEVPDDLSGDALDDWIEEERYAGNHPRRFVELESTHWERAD